jgi:hypothetical protein
VKKERDHHYQKAHYIRSKFQCAQCLAVFQQKYNLSRHEKVIHNKEKVSFPSEGPFVCKEPGCEKVFKWRSTFKDHKQKHSTLKRLGCLKCERTFASNRTLIRHLKIMHREKKPAIGNFFCKMCNKRYRYEESFKYHCEHSNEHLERLKTKAFIFVPNKKYRHPCSQCDKTYLFKSSLRRHLSVKHGLFESVFKCKICPNKTFKSKLGLEYHVKKVQSHKYFQRLLELEDVDILTTSEMATAATEEETEADPLALGERAAEEPMEAKEEQTTNEDSDLMQIMEELLTSDLSLACVWCNSASIYNLTTLSTHITECHFDVMEEGLAILDVL